MLPAFPVEVADLLEFGILLRLAKGSALPLLFVRGLLAPAPDVSVADELGSLRLDPPEEGSSGILNAPSIFGVSSGVLAPGKWYGDWRWARGYRADRSYGCLMFDWLRLPSHAMARGHFLSISDVRVRLASRCPRCCWIDDARS